MARREFEMVWTQLHLPRPLDEAAVQSLLLVLGSQRRPTPVVFELRAARTGIRYLLGCESIAVARITRLIRDGLPGVAFSSAAARFDPVEAGRLRLSPRTLPLRTDAALDTVRALLSALNVRLKTGELLAVQVVLGRPNSPTPVRPDASSPTAAWWRPLVSGAVPATAEERRALRIRAEDASFAACVRIAAAGSDPERTRRLTISLQSALRVARAPGVRMEFAHDQVRSFAEARLPRRGVLELACAELVGLLGWPLGTDDLPGVPPLHPLPVRPSEAITSEERAFARSGVPGDERLVGITADDSLQHVVALGPSGSGKSTAALHLIKASMEAGQPVLVLDPKKQLIDDVLRVVPKERLDQVVLLDAADTPVVGYNPLDTTGRDADVVVDGILSVFGGIFSEGWGPRTADIFSATLRTLTRAAEATGTPATLPDIPRLLTDSTFRRRLVGHVQGDEALASFWGWYEDLSPQGQANVIASPLNKLRQVLLRPALVRMLDQRDSKFQLRNIWRDNLIVLVPLNEGLIGSGTASLLGALIAADVWLAVQERANERDPQKHPGFVFVDEAPRFLHLPTGLADALAVSRSLGVGWFLAAQFRDQFPKALARATDMNARSKIVFATEYEDARHYARGEQHLTPEDWRALGRFQAFANIVAKGHPQGWALVETLPPPRAVMRPERIRARSRATWAGQGPPAGGPDPSADVAPPGALRADTEPTDGQPDYQLGRKRRRQP
jgi:hypothetical protein